MALFNITNAPGITLTDKDFMTSNMNIHIDTLELTISRLQITDDQWSGIF